MWVDSLIKRTNGHVVELGGVSYAFNADNGYCCEVTDPTHLARFREIPEGYQVSGAATSVVEPEPPVPAPPAPSTSARIPQRRTRRFSPPQQAVLMPDEERG